MGSFLRAIGLIIMNIHFSRNFVTPLLLMAALLMVSPVLSQTNLFVGNGSSNQTTNITSGTSSYSNTFIGVNSGDTNNRLNVLNVNTLLSNSADLYVGVGGSGNSLVISNGSQVQNANAILGDSNTSSNNSVSVIGTGSIWSNNAFLYVGYSGSSNSLMISNGGQVFANSNSFVGYGITSSNNSAVVTGTGSIWSNSSGFAVGGNGFSNSLVISNGGKVQDTLGVLADFATSSNNSVVVTGTGSTWSNIQGVEIGAQGSSNSLVISNGGKVQSTSNGILSAFTTSSNNSVLVTGAGSVWTNGGSLSVGDQGSGNSLVISNGGLVQNASNGIIGDLATSSNNSVFVTAAGSTWSNGGTLYVGNQGAGTLTIATGGSVVATGGLAIAGVNGSVGTVNLGVLGGSSTGISLSTPVIQFGSGSGTLNFNQSDVLTESASISGPGTLNQLGSGTTTLTGTNSYSGGTFVSNGVLIGNTTSLQGSITNNASLVFIQTNNGTYSGILSGTGLLTKNGVGTVTLSAANSYSGGTKLDAGSVGIGNNAAFGSGTVSFVSNSIVTAVANLLVTNSYVVTTGVTGTFDVTPGNALTNSGVISGSGALSKTDTGTLVLSGSNSYSGGTVLNAGTLVITNGGMLGASNGTVTLTGGTLDLGGQGSTNGAFVLASGTLQNGSLSATSYSLTNGTISAALTGAGSLTQDGGGTVTLSGASTYTGASTLFGGTLVAASTNALGNGAVTLGGGVQTATLNLATNLTISSMIWTTNSILELIPGVASLNITGVFSNTLVSAGSNVFNFGGFVGTGTNVLINFASGSGFTTNSFSVLGNTNWNFILTGTNLSAFYNAPDLYVGINTAGNSTNIPSGTNLYNNTYVGFAVNASNNILVVTGTNGSNALLTNTGNLFVGDNGSSNSMVVSNAGKVYDVNGTLGSAATASNNSALVTGTGLWSNSGTLTIGDAGNGTVTVANGGTLAASNIVIAAQSNSSGTLNDGRFGGSDTAGTIASPTITFGNGTGTINFNQVNSTTITSSITGAGFVNQLGTGNTTLKGSNSYTGPTTVKAGSLEFGGTQSFYSGDTNQWTATNLIVYSNATVVFTVGGGNSFTSSELSEIITNGTATTGFRSGSFLGLDTTGTNFVFSGNLANPNGGSNALGLTLLGNGTLDLSGSNSYSGGTLIQSGTLALGSTNALGSGTVNLNGGTLDLTSQTNVANNLTLTKGILTNGSYNIGSVTLLSGTVASSLIGSSSLTINTAGKNILLSGSNSYTGPTVIQAGTVEFGGTQALYDGNTNVWNGNLTVSSNATTIFTIGGSNAFTSANLDQLVTNSTATTGFLNGSSLGIDTTGTNFTYASNLGNPNGGSNALALKVFGNGTLDLTGTNTYTGGTLISASTTIGNRTLSAGTLEGDSTSLQGTITNNGTLIFNQITNGIYSGVMSGSGSLTKNGIGTLTLAANNTYSGGTTLNAGTLAISNNNALGTGLVTFASNSMITALTNLTVANNYSIAGGVTGTFDVLPGATLTNPGVISGSGTLSKIDGGTLILAALNTYTGGTIISGGTLQVGNGATSGSLGSGTVVDTTSLTFGNSSSQTISNNISGSGSITQFGSGTTILSGSNSYTGGTTLNGGTVDIENSSAFGTGSVTFASNSTVKTLTTITVTNTYVVSIGVTNIFDVASGASLTNSGVITGGGSLVSMGAGTLTLTGTNDYTGGTLLTAGTLVVTNNGTLGSTNGTVTITGGTLKMGGNLIIGALILQGGTLQGGPLSALSFDVGSGTISADLGGGSLTKNGSGTVTLTGSNSYTNGVTLNGGTVDVGNSNAFGTGTVTFASNSTITALTNLTLTNNEVLSNGVTGTLDNGGNKLTNEGGITGGGALTLTGSGTTTLTASNGYTGGTLLDQGTVAISNSNAFGTGTVTFASNRTITALTNLTLTNNEVLSNGVTGTLNNGGNELTNDGGITGGGALTLTGTGTTTLTASNGYTGGTLLDQGTVAISNSNAFGTGTVTFVSNTTIATLTNLTVTNAYAIATNVTGTFDVGSNNILTNSGAISGSGNLTKSDSGTLTLTGSNSYTGVTTLTGGTLLLNGTNSGGGNILVNSNTTLGGTGSATNSAVTVASGGTLTPGTGSTPGTLSIGSLTLNTGSILNVVLSNTSTSLVDVTGNATLGGTVNFTSLGTLTNAIYTFLMTTGTVSGSFTNIANLPSDYQLVYGSNSVFLQEIANPGPITANFGGGTNAIITGGSTNILLSVTNTSPTGSANLIFTATNSTNTTGSIGSTTVTPQSGTNSSGLAYNGTNVGTNQGTIITVVSGSTNFTTNVPVTVVVYDHAQSQLSGTNLVIPEEHVGYTNVLTSTNTIILTNESGLRVDLGTTNTSTNTLLGLDSVTSLAPGTPTNLSATLLPGQGVGSFTNTVVVTSYDASGLNGASTNLGTTNVSVSGLIYSGQATWTNNGSGTWNSFSNWDVNGGTPGLAGPLSSNDTATFDTNGLTVGSGTVTLTTNAALSALTFSNAAASYTIAGTGTLILQGTNQPTINNFAGSHTITTAVDLATNVIVNDVTNSKLAIGGSISGIGGLSQDGDGTVLLSSSNSYSGGTLINAGKLITSNPNALGSGGVALNGGTLEILSRLNISSLLWTNSAAQIAIPNPGAGNFVHVSGDITLGSSKDYFNLTGAKITTTPTELLYFGTNKLTVGDFGVKGVSHDTLLIIGDALFIEAIANPTPSPSDNTESAKFSFSPFAQNRNQSGVASALNSFLLATSGDQQVVAATLENLPPAELPAALDAISPSLYLSLSTIAFNSANAQNNELVQQLWGLRVAGAGFSMNGMPDNTPVLQQPEPSSDGKDFKSPVSAKDYKQPVSPKRDILQPGEDNHWGMFLDAYGIFAQANSGNMLPTYNAESGGVVTGLTYKWNENFGTGIYTGYQGTYAKYNAGSSLIDNAVLFGVFGTYGQADGKGFYADALAGGGYNNYNVSRNINFGSLNRTATSSPGAGELTSLLALGYNVKRGNWTFGPLASLQYTYLGVNPVNETGAQSLDFNSSAWNSSSLLSSLGGQVGYTWQANRDIVVVPQLSLAWQHEFMQNPYAINGSLGGSPTFSTWGATPLRDTLYTGVGFTVEFYKKWSTSLFYNASAGNPNLVSQNIFLGLGVKF